MRTIITLLLAVMLAAPLARADEQVVDSTLAVVNGKIITLGEVLKALQPAITKLEEKHQGDQLKQRIETLIGMEMTARKNEILLTAEAERVLEKAAKAHVDKLVSEAVKDEAAAAGSKAAFVAKLQKADKTLEDFERLQRSRYLVEILLYRQVYSKVRVGPARIVDYYDTHRDEFSRSETATVQHIVLTHSEYRDKAETRRAADKVYREARAGSDFAGLAKKWSDGPYAKQGGLWSAVARGSFVREVDDVLFSLAPGTLAPVVCSRIGCHILRLIELQPARTLTFTEAQPEIERKLRAQEIDRLRETYLTRIEKSSYVKILWKRGND